MLRAGAAEAAVFAGESTLGHRLRVQHHDREPTIGAPAITAAVAPFELQKAGLVQSIEWDNSFHSRLAVERRCTDPGGAALVQFVPTPEADMVPLARPAADGLLESKVLLSAK
jgi:hypothetical protein